MTNLTQDSTIWYLSSLEKIEREVQPGQFVLEFFLVAYGRAQEELQLLITLIITAILRLDNEP